MKYFPTIVIAFLTVVGIPLLAYTEELVEFHPHFSLTGYYDDNIDFSPQTGSEDMYLKMSPGLSSRLNLKWLPIEADYTYTRYQYHKRNDLTRDFHNFSIKTLKALRIFNNVTLKIDEKYDTVPVDINLPASQPSNLTQRNTFSVKPLWEKYFSRKMKFAAGYEFSRVDYTSSGLTGDDYYGHRFFFRWDGEIYRSLIIYQKDQYQLKYFKTAPDYTQFLPEAGVKMKFGRRLTLDVNGGYSFDQTGDEKHGGYVYSVVGGWIPASRIKLQATFRQNRTTDVQGEPYTEEYYELNLDYKASKRARWVHGLPLELIKVIKNINQSVARSKLVDQVSVPFQ